MMSDVDEAREQLIEQIIKDNGLQDTEEVREQLRQLIKIMSDDEIKEEMKGVLRAIARSHHLSEEEEKVLDVFLLPDVITRNTDEEDENNYDEYIYCVASNKMREEDAQKLVAKGVIYKIENGDITMYCIRY